MIRGFTDFGHRTLSNRYVLEGETPEMLLERVAGAYADNGAHKTRLLHYMQNFWFMPATPILSNAGSNRGLPISCFLNQVEDNIKSIADVAYENIFLAARGGGIGVEWGNVRSIGEICGINGETCGIIPFIKMQDSQSIAISQGSLRRGSSAAYLPVSHPEINEFLSMRKPVGGDHNRKCLELHHGVVISDEFMWKVMSNNAEDRIWHLKSPLTGDTIDTVDARDLWIDILTTRLETGEPYILFEDAVNRARPEIYKELDLKVRTSNLCTEIMLTTGKDYLDKTRTAVCCLSSLNLEYFDEWITQEGFIEDVMRFLDNVLEDFITRAPKEVRNAVHSAKQERSVGLGVMGFHSYLQKKNIAIEDEAAACFNDTAFKFIRREADAASIKLAEEKGSCLDAEALDLKERFTHKLAIAPTASISGICGGTSPGIEPWVGNTFTQKTLSGSFAIRNKYLEKSIAGMEKNADRIWSYITTNEGSIQDLSFIDEGTKRVFKTAFEIDQHVLIDLAAQRQQYIDQGQSLNIFCYANVNKKALHAVHKHAWASGLKSLYYCRSKSLQRAEKSAENVEFICSGCD